MGFRSSVSQYLSHKDGGILAILAQAFFNQFPWQVYICPGRLHQSWNDEQIYVLFLF